MRILAFLEYAAIVAGIVGMAAGRFFGLPAGLYLGVFLVGAGIALGALESLGTQRMGFRSAEDQWEAYAGAPAVIVGLMALVVGGVLIGCAYALSEGAWPSLSGYLARRPGPVLIGGGFLAACAGVLMMLNPRGRRGWAWVILVRIPRWLLGCVVVLAGFCAVALGLWEMLEPRGYARFIANLPREVDRLRRMLR